MAAPGVVGANGRTGWIDGSGFVSHHWLHHCCNEEGHSAFTAFQYSSYLRGLPDDMYTHVAY